MSRHTCRALVTSRESTTSRLIWLILADQLLMTSIVQPMTSIVQQSISLGSCSTSPLFKTPTIKKRPYIKSCLAGSSDKYKAVVGIRTQRKGICVSFSSQRLMLGSSPNSNMGSNQSQPQTQHIWIQFPTNQQNSLKELLSEQISESHN